MQRSRGDVAAEISFNRALDRQLQVLQVEPNDVATLSHMGGVYNNLAMLQGEMDRVADAEASFELAIERQRQALNLAGNHQFIRQLLSKHYYNYAERLANDARYADALQAAMERRDLWPHDPALLHSAAEQLASIGQRAQAGGLKAKADSLQAEAAAKGAVETLRLAIAAGLEPARLSSPAFAALASRPDFTSLRHSASIGKQPTGNLVDQ
jgi:tetratricopeptide (TPR) repeat protein